MSGSNSEMEDLKRTQTSSLSISPELFEKLYLSPQNAVKGDLRKTFGNPTPLAVVGFVVALSPLSIELMEWRGASGQNATIGANYYFGGMLLILSGFLEFFLGNTFPSVVFFGYGAHFLAFAATGQPFYAAISSYTDPSSPSQTMTPAFLASFGFYLLFMSLLSLIYLVCSLRTNLIFVFVFISATLGFALGAAGFWSLAEGKVVVGQKLLQGTGGSFFAAAMFGWYLLAAIMFAELDLPWIKLPVVDLSGLIKGASQKMKEKEV